MTDIRTGKYLVVENPSKGPVKVLSLHRSLKAAVAKCKKLRRRSAEPWRFTVNYDMAYSTYPGPTVDLV